MFAQRLKELRKDRGLTQIQFAQQFHVSNGAVAMWETGKREPDFDTMNRLAAFFNVTVDYLLGNVTDPFFQLDNDRILQDINSYESESTSTLTDRDRRDIARDLERIMEALDTAGDLQFDGDPMSDEARESIRAAMKLGLEAAKVKNKERFTPKKFRKE